MTWRKIKTGWKKVSSSKNNNNNRKQRKWNWNTKRLSATKIWNSIHLCLSLYFFLFRFCLYSKVHAHSVQWSLSVSVSVPVALSTGQLLNWSTSKGAADWKRKKQYTQGNVEFLCHPMLSINQCSTSKRYLRLADIFLIKKYKSRMKTIFFISKNNGHHAKLLRSNH